MNFVEKYPIANLNPADYNPRKISSEAFGVLKGSLQKYGIVKPVILNGTGILTAGHQRIKAMKSLGINETPAIILENISRHDEIRFNLYHNSIETNKSEVFINSIDKYPEGFSMVPYGEYTCGENKNATVSKSIAELYVKYGNWGSVVVDEFGKIILNSDYAVVMDVFMDGILIYKLAPGIAKDFIQIMHKDYGEYYYENLSIKPYVQLHCQMSRRIKDQKTRTISSTLYEKFVMKSINKNQRIIDFGAGKMVYVNHLRKIGYKIFGYEPYFKEGKTKILIAEVIKHLDKIRRDIILNKLYDVVVLDSVINSITSLDYEKYVLTVCNGLMKKDGILYLATRSLESCEERMRSKIARSKTRLIEFLDKDNFSVTYREGNWTMQRFHSVQSLKTLLSNYFQTIELIPGDSQNYAICKDPIPLSIEKYKEAFDIELNMEYPNGLRHNKHEELLKLIIELISNRDMNKQE